PSIDLIYGMPTLEPDDLVMASVPGLPKPDEIIDKYIQALGGAQQLANVTAFAATGTSIGFGGFGGGGAVQIYAKAPDQRSTIIDREVDVVQGNGPGRLFATLYFDKQTALLTRMIRYGTSPIGRLPTQVDYADYREVNGVRMPFRFTFAWLDGRDAFQLNDLRVNV